MEENDSQDILFYVVDQFNRGTSKIIDPEEKHKLVKLNLEAGRKAKMSAAFWPGIRYFKKGIALLEETCWEAMYDLAYALYMEAAETAYLSGDYKEMNTLLESALKPRMPP